jgi:hypothetical protein
LDGRIEIYTFKKMDSSGGVKYLWAIRDKENPAYWTSFSVGSVDEVKHYVNQFLKEEAIKAVENRRR